MAANSLYSHEWSLNVFSTCIHSYLEVYIIFYKAPREILWTLGVLILLTMMATAFVGYVLPWGQMSFGGATVITNLFSVIILSGRILLLGSGEACRQSYTQSVFSLHYLLFFVIFGLVFLHLWALHTHKSNNPLGIEAKGDKDEIPHPYYTIKDLLVLEYS